jgi:LysM repeat protein
MPSNQLLRLGLVICCCLIWWGCSPPGPGATDEAREPQFLIGRSRVNAMDYQGAIEAFEQALETNPRSAAAHFELGILNAEKAADPAAAIYHYQKYLQLRPDAGNFEAVQGQIVRLKQELARGVLPIPPSPGLQRQLEQMAAENRQLRDELNRLRVASAQTQASDRAGAKSPQPEAGGSDSATRTPINRTASAATRSARSGASSRVHRVRAGETLTAIARRYHIKLESLYSVNPGLNPRKLRIGQSLVIPGL